MSKVQVQPSRVPVVVVVNFTYDTTMETGTTVASPTNCSLPCNSKYGITWVLNARDQEGKRINAAFDGVDGVVFTGTGIHQWRGRQPTADGYTYQVEAPFGQGHQNTLTYPYYITVIYNGRPFGHDPEIEDEGENPRAVISPESEPEGN